MLANGFAASPEEEMPHFHHTEQISELRRTILRWNLETKERVALFPNSLSCGIVLHGTLGYGAPPRGQSRGMQKRDDRIRKKKEDPTAHLT